jgi:pyruvate/oxaloacetate carboxyltransferase
MLLTVVTMTLAACTWVKPTAESDRVRLADAAGVASCNRIGTITTRVKDRIGFIARSPEKVRGELATLARLEAVDMGADTVVAEGPVSEGHRTYSAWDCP